ncbi:MAG TPA: CDP-glucose 4,6-dehydratase [Desulfomonilia bacterium]
MFNDFFNNKSVLITGHTGFKGSWLALWLNELGARVTGLALNPNTEPSHFSLIGLDNNITSIEGDIRDSNVVSKAFKEVEPEIIFHLAAQALVRDSYMDPKGTFDTNIGGTINVLEAVRLSPCVRAAVIVTSDKCYENRECVWGYRENDPMGGHDPYSASKGAAEIVCSAYQRSFFDKEDNLRGFATARAGNVIGGGDWAKDRIIPDCIRALSMGKPILVRKPDAIRPWQHVLDSLSGYLLLAMKIYNDPARFSGSWNFGPAQNSQIRVMELAEKFVSAWGNGSIVTPEVQTKNLHEAHLLKLCIDKAVYELGWKPLLDSRAAIEWTVEWYKAWHENKMNMRDISLKQIRQIQNLISKEGF